jgi:thioredoxin reductase (NADPH)
MFEDLTYEELKRRANTPLPQGVVAALEKIGVRRTVAVGDRLYQVDGPMKFVYSVSAKFEVRDFESVLLGELEPGQYSGELGVLLRQTAFADCIVTAPGDVIVVEGPAIAELIEVDPEVGDILMTAFAARRVQLMRRQQGTLILVGPEGAPGLAKVREYAERNRIPYRELDPSDAANTEEIKVCAAEGPGVKVVVRGRHVLRNPEVTEVARALGLEFNAADGEAVDLVIAGAGPAGLSAAVYGASEGLKTVLLDDVAIGGQSAQSSRIENFLGFPTGLSGTDLAFRAELQAVKFGARLAVPRRAQALSVRKPDGLYELLLDNGRKLIGRSVILATGARYRKLGLDGEDRLQGAGVFYAATEMEARACHGREVVVVGGGNSAGQAAMFLSARASCVRLVCRGKALAASMSQYLVERLEHAPNVKIEMGSQVVSLAGDERLERVVIKDGAGQTAERQVCGLFVMIGADPCTSWLKDALQLDSRGFILTGEGCGKDAPAPYNAFQTSLAGVFAVGDVRSGSVKRVASAVGEGSVVVSAIHARLATLRETETRATVTV